MSTSIQLYDTLFGDLETAILINTAVTSGLMWGISKAFHVAHPASSAVLGALNGASFYPSMRLGQAVEDSIKEYNETIAKIVGISVFLFGETLPAIALTILLGFPINSQVVLVWGVAKIINTGAIIIILEKVINEIKLNIARGELLKTTALASLIDIRRARRILLEEGN